jgi:hypothetical protein
MRSEEDEGENGEAGTRNDEIASSCRCRTRNDGGIKGSRNVKLKQPATSNQ